MKIYFIRHGETDWNKDLKFQGWHDTDLNDTGREQARQASLKMRSAGICPDRIYCSPLRRAKETAEILTGMDPSAFIIDERLKEMTYGPYEGVSIIESMADQGMKDFLEHPYDFPPPEGIESLQHLEARMAEALDDIIKDAPPEKTGGAPHEYNILICSHGMAISTLFRHISQLNGSDLKRQPVHNATLYVSEVRDGIPGMPEEVTAQP